MQTEWSKTVAALVGYVIHTRRRELGLSMTVLAAAVGSHRPIVGRIEKGRLHLPNLETLKRYADALELPMTEFGWCCDLAGPPPGVVAPPLITFERLTAAEGWSWPTTSAESAGEAESRGAARCARARRVWEDSATSGSRRGRSSARR